MSKSVFILTKNEFDEGYEFNDPYGPSETTTVFGVCSSKQLADDACKARAEQDIERYSESVDKVDNGYSFETDNGWITYSYEEFELDKDYK